MILSPVAILSFLGDKFLRVVVKEPLILSGGSEVPVNGYELQLLAILVERKNFIKRR